MSVKARFWKKVQKTDSCWLWTAAIYREPTGGYGKFGWYGKPDRAHRCAWRLVHGDIPQGMFVLHHCDNRLRVNPAHLYLGGHKQNRNDCVSRKRHSFGEQHPSARLTEMEVRAIRNRYEAGERISLLAASYGMSFEAISGIVHGRKWRHLLSEAA